MKKFIQTKHALLREQIKIVWDAVNKTQLIVGNAQGLTGSVAGLQEFQDIFSRRLLFLRLVSMNVDDADGWVQRYSIDVPKLEQEELAYAGITVVEVVEALVGTLERNVLDEAMKTGGASESDLKVQACKQLSEAFNATQNRPLENLDA